VRNGSRFPLLLLALFSLWTASRLVPRYGEPPAFYVYTQPQWQLALADGWSKPGIHQFFDDNKAGCVNVLTEKECNGLFVDVFQGLSGLKLALTEAGKPRFDGWLPASQRMALQIPLHPDRMEQSDWQALPGLGPSLGKAIEQNRQENGDFGSVRTLLRVKGIGQKRLADFSVYFE